MVPEIVPLAPHVRNYSWGSKSLVPRFIGLPDSREPIAELWYGAHQSGSSRVMFNDEPLSEIIASNSREVLGDDVSEFFGSRLPFMLKIIAIEDPLSIQVHPNLAQAEEGMLRNPELYSDEFAKPEQLIALTTMSVMYGFRPLHQVLAIFKDFDCPEIKTSLESTSVATTFLKLLRGQFESEYLNIRESSRLEASALVRSLSQKYPHDRAALAPYFLNVVVLKPGESIAINPGEVHAYLSGFGVEVLGNSDNVLRAGLTHKVKNLEEFEAVVSKTSIDVKTETPILDGLHWWKSKYEEFKVGFYNQVCSGVKINGPSIVLIVDGRLEAASNTDIFNFTRGEGFFIKGTAQVTLEGDAQAYVCTTNINH